MQTPGVRDIILLYSPFLTFEGLVAENKTLVHIIPIIIEGTWDKLSAFQSLSGIHMQPSPERVIEI